VRKMIFYVLGEMIENSMMYFMVIRVTLFLLNLLLKTPKSYSKQTASLILIYYEFVLCNLKILSHLCMEEPYTS
jgi:hypothetical protein